jgi:Zn-finger nucleic acid-binding protein
MNCGNCGASARLDLERGLIVCDYCGTEAVPPIGEDGVQVLVTTEFPCPACASTLSQGRLGGINMLYCASCHGMLITMDDFMPVVETLRTYRSGPSSVLPRPEDGKSGTARSCPHCGGPMENHAYGGGGNVFIDTCEACSVNWLDKGELQRIVAAPDHAAYAPLYSSYGGASESD